MRGVDAADAANAVRRQEFVPAQQPLEDARQHPVGDQRQQVLAPLVFPIRALADDTAVEHAVTVLAQQFAEPGTLARMRRSTTSQANSGINPTQEYIVDPVASARLGKSSNL